MDEVGMLRELKILKKRYKKECDIFLDEIGKFRETGENEKMIAVTNNYYHCLGRVYAYDEIMDIIRTRQ